jgi:hypothetical protein
MSAKQKAIFNLVRDHYGIDALGRETTLGFLLDEKNNPFCYTLEDVVRAEGIKCKKRTAIPATGHKSEYLLDIRTSPKYGEIVVIYTSIENGMYVLDYKGVRFTMILAHGGNDADDTEGCVLVNKDRSIGDMKAWGSQKTALVTRIKALKKQGKLCVLRVHNMPYAE